MKIDGWMDGWMDQWMGSDMQAGRQAGRQTKTAFVLAALILQVPLAELVNLIMQVKNFATLMEHKHPLLLMV
jgi:hypothetical protein